MPDISIKINTSKQKQRDIKKALNLNLPQTAPPTKKSKFWPFLTLIIFGASLAMAALFYLEKTSEKWPYSEFIPENHQAAAHIRLSQFSNEGALLLSWLEADSDFFRWLKERTLNFVQDSGLNAGQILELFEDEAIIVSLPKPGLDGNSWFILAKTRADQTDLKQSVVGKIEIGFKKYFYLNELTYRQLKIRSVCSLKDQENPYFYALAGDYAVISNDQEALQAVLDKIIEK